MLQVKTAEVPPRVAVIDSKNGLADDCRGLAVGVAWQTAHANRDTQGVHILDMIDLLDEGLKTYIPAA